MTLGQIRADATNFARIMSDLTEYYTDVYTEAMITGVTKVSQEVMDEVKRLAPRKTGEYIRHFALKTRYRDKRNFRRAWYVKDPEYRLTHLLEYGHVVHVRPYGNKYAGLRYYGISKKIPHVEPGKRLRDERIVAVTREAIERAQ